MAAVLAIDHGTRRTGFAIADALRITCAPLEVFHGDGRGAELLEAVARILAERDVDTFLVGYPTGAEGKVGARAREVDEFLTALAQRFPDVARVRWDERLTTKEAEDRLRASGHHGTARKQRRDSWSAWVLLEDWLRAGEPREPAP